jgi:hypothetical protein
MIEHRLLSSHSVRDRRRRKKKEREERSQRNDKEKCVRRENDIFIPMKFFSFCQDINSWELYLYTCVYVFLRWYSVKENNLARTWTMSIDQYGFLLFSLSPVVLYIWPVNGNDFLTSLVWQCNLSIRTMKNNSAVRIAHSYLSEKDDAFSFLFNLTYSCASLHLCKKSNWTTVYDEIIETLLNGFDRMMPYHFLYIRIHSHGKTRTTAILIYFPKKIRFTFSSLVHRRRRRRRRVSQFAD